MKNDKSKFKNEFKKRTYQFAPDVISFIDNLPQHNTSTTLGNQLLRSATSIGANVTEASAASSRRDYINFFNHDLKSANETRFWIGLLRDSDKGDKNTMNKLLQESIEIANILASSILTLKGKK